MVVHYAGLPVDMDAMLQLGLPVVEDAAHAIDSSYKGRWCGSIGDVGIFSFDAVKNIATPDLGAVVTRNPVIADWVRSVRYSGVTKSGADRSLDNASWWITKQRAVMPKYSPNDVAAAMALSQLERIDTLQSSREQLWNLYIKRLSSVHNLAVPPSRIGYHYRHSRFTFFVRVPAEIRDSLAHFLLAKGVYTTVRYSPLHLLEIFRPSSLVNVRSLPGSERFASEVLNLPLHPRMTPADVHLVCDLIESFLSDNQSDDSE